MSDIMGLIKPVWLEGNRFVFKFWVAFNTRVVLTELFNP